MTTSSLINKQCHCDNQVIHKVIQTKSRPILFRFFLSKQKIWGFVFTFCCGFSHSFILLTDKTIETS